MSDEKTPGPKERPILFSGAMTRAKIDAAQALGVPVLMVDRPALRRRRK